MTIEPIISFLILLDVRKILRATSPDPEWDKNLKYGMYAIAALFVIDIVLRANGITKWIWHLVILAIIAIIYFNSKFFGARKIMLAVIPLVVLSLLSDIFKSFLPNTSNLIDKYLDVAIVFSIIWMVAMLI